MDNPISKFESWWQEALADSQLQQKSAVCVSTIDENGFPAGRFVDLKSVSDSGFIFCSYFDSVKGKHIAREPKTAMTVWWDHVGYQILTDEQVSSFAILAKEANVTMRVV